MRALGALDDDDLAPLHAAAAQGRARVRAGVPRSSRCERPDLAGLVPVVLYETLGPTLGAGNEAAALALGRRAHLRDELSRVGPARRLRRATGPALGEALFEAILTRRSGVTFTVDEYDETWRRLATPDGKINLAIPELLDELAALRDEQPATRRASSRSCCRPASAARRPPTRSSAIRRGGRRTRPARCA